MTLVRVLRLITRMNIGGPALHAAILSARLDGGFETLLVSGREAPIEGSIFALGRIREQLRMQRVSSLGRAVSPFDDMRALLTVLAIARAYRPRLIHTHLAKAGFVGRVVGRLVGSLVVHTYHGSVFHGYFGRRESSLYLGIERALARLSAKLVAITARQRQELIELRVAPPEKIAEIPLGLDLDMFRGAVDKGGARRALGLPEDLAIVGLVARLVPVKDVGTFIRALALLRPRMPGFIGVVVGDGEERLYLERLAADLGLEGHCRFLGWRADMPRVYAALDVLALCSRNEGSPVSVIEAMASGRPVVATSVGGVPDVVSDGENGFLVKDGDPRALAERLADVLTDPALQARLGAAAREAVYPRFDAARLVADVRSLYLSLLDR